MPNRLGDKTFGRHIQTYRILLIKIGAYHSKLCYCSWPLCYHWYLVWWLDFGLDSNPKSYYIISSSLLTVLLSLPTLLPLELCSVVRFWSGVQPSNLWLLSSALLTVAIAIRLQLTMLFTFTGCWIQTPKLMIYGQVPYQLSHICWPLVFNFSFLVWIRTLNLIISHLVPY